MESLCSLMGTLGDQKMMEILASENIVRREGPEGSREPSEGNLNFDIVLLVQIDSDVQVLSCLTPERSFVDGELPDEEASSCVLEGAAICVLALPPDRRFKMLGMMYV